MVSVRPIEDSTFRNPNTDSEFKDSVFTKNQLNSLSSVPNDSKTVSRMFKPNLANVDSQSGAKSKSNSADNILDGSRKGGKGSKKSKKRDRSKRAQTITYVTEEAEHVFEAFCSTNKGRPSSAPNSFHVKIVHKISEDKMKRLKKIVKNASDSDCEMENQSGLKERKKKSFFKRIKERIMALNKKQPLFERSQREREREIEFQKEKEKNPKFTNKIFDSFRNRRKPKKNNATLKKMDSDNYTNQSTDDPFNHSGFSILSDQPCSPKLGQDIGNLPTPSSLSYPFSPSFLPDVIYATAEESRIMNENNENNEDEDSKVGSAKRPLTHPSQSAIRGHPYLAFFDSVHVAGSSVDRKRGLGRLEGYADMRFIDEDIDEDDIDTTLTNKSLNDTGKSCVNKGSMANGNDVDVSQSSVDSKELSMSSLADSGCEDVVDKYEQVAKLLDKISQEVNEEMRGMVSESSASALDLARKLASKSSYQLFQSQLNELLLQLNEPLLNQVALLFSVTRSAINLVGINSENASKLKHYLLLYYNSHFALQVASVGGLESLTEDSDT